MRALRRAVKNRLACCVRDVVCNEAVPFRPYCGGVVTRTRNVSEYILVLALCLVCSCDPGNFGSKTAQFASRLIILVVLCAFSETSDVTPSSLGRFGTWCNLKTGNFLRHWYSWLPSDRPTATDDYTRQPCCWA